MCTWWQWYTVMVVLNGDYGHGADGNGNADIGVIDGSVLWEIKNIYPAHWKVMPHTSATNSPFWSPKDLQLCKAKCQGELILMLETGHVWPGSLRVWHEWYDNHRNFHACTCNKHCRVLQIVPKKCQCIAVWQNLFFSQNHCWPVTPINKNMSLELQGWTFLGVSMSWPILWGRDLTDG